MFQKSNLSLNTVHNNTKCDKNISNQRPWPNG